MDRKTSCWAILLGSLLVGCATSKPHLASSDFPSAAKSIKTVGVVVAEARVVGLSAGGSLEVDIERTGLCLSQLEEAAVTSLRQRGFDAVLLAYDDEIRRLVTEYAPVQERLAGARDGRQPIETVPPMTYAQQVATSRALDAIAFVSVRFIIPSLGRHALSALGWGSSGESRARLALFDATGRPIYYQFLYEAKDNFSKTSGKTLERFCETLTAGIPQRSP